MKQVGIFKNDDMDVTKTEIRGDSLLNVNATVSILTPDTSRLQVILHFLILYQYESLARRVM